MPSCKCRSHYGTAYALMKGFVIKLSSQTCSRVDISCVIAIVVVYVQGIRLANGDQVQFASDPPPLPSPAPPAVPGNATPQVAAVYTTEQLQQVMLAGVRDIEIRAHLDLRNLTMSDLTEVPPGSSDFRHVSPQTRSIRVRI